jgi:hypothetical protein
MTRISKIMKADEETFKILEENTSIILALFKNSKNFSGSIYANR